MSKEAKTQNKKERRRTWKNVSEADSKKLYLILAVLSISLGALTLLMCLLPAISIQDLSLGSNYKLAFDYFKKLLKSDSVFDYTFEIGMIPAICLICVTLGILLLLKGIVYLFFSFKVKPMCIYKKIKTKKFIFTSVVVLSFFLLTLWYTRICAKEYLFSCIWPIVLLGIHIAVAYATIIIKLLLIRKSESITFEKVNHLVDQQKTNRRERSEISGTTALMIIIAILLLTLHLFQIHSYTFTGLFKFEYDPIELTVMGDSISVGKKATPFKLTVQKYNEDISTFDFGVNESLKSRYSLTYSDSYRYYSKKLKPISEEIELLTEKMLVQVLDAETFEKYQDRLQDLLYKEAALKNTLSRLTVPYEYYEITSVTGGFMATEYVYDTKILDKTQYKYGNSKANLFSFEKESAVILENEFTQGTDFNNVTIVAKVLYIDGSIKISIITPSNISELNSAKKGTTLVKWSDDWGEYEAEIVIK